MTTTAADAGDPLSTEQIVAKVRTAVVCIVATK